MTSSCYLLKRPRKTLPVSCTLTMFPYRTENRRLAANLCGRHCGPQKPCGDGLRRPRAGFSGIDSGGSEKTGVAAYIPRPTGRASAKCPPRKPSAIHRARWPVLRPVHYAKIAAGLVFSTISLSTWPSGSPQG